MEDKLKNLQSQMAEQLIQTQKLVGQSSQMVMMMQNIQELLKKSFNVSHNSALNSNSENPQEDDYGGTNPECLQIAPNSLPNSNSNPSSENHPPQCFGYVQKLDFSIFDGTNSENHLHKSLEKLSFFEVEVTECPKLVSQLYFEDDKQEPTLFAAFPICFNDGTVVHSPEKNIYEHGKTYDRPQELYEPVKAWKFVESVKPANSVLTVMDNWSGPDKPWVSYEGCCRTLLIALNFVNILKWKLGLHGKFVWYKLSKILDVLEEKPPPHDLVVHKHLREAAVEHDEGDGTGVAKSVEWLWEIICRFDGIFEGFEHLPESFDVMASMLVDEGMIREAQLWLSETEMRVTTLDQNMVSATNDLLLQSETTCGSLLYGLQKIWDEVGETDSSRDKMLSELEQECLEVYKRKVDQVSRSTAQLRQAIADSESQLVIICSVMGELPVNIWQTFFERLDIPLLWEMHLVQTIWRTILLPKQL